MKVFIGRKKIEHYKGLTIKADLRLHEQIATRVRSEVPPGGKILDLGAGEGALSARLNDLGYEVHAADIDEAGFGSLEVPFTRVDFDRPDDIEAFVAEHASRYDAVLGIEVIEHVQDQWQYVRQLLRLAAPGGLVLVTTPNVTSWFSRLIFLFTGRFHQFADSDLDYGHISPVTPWELELIMRRCGAADVRLEPAGTLPPVYVTGLNKLALLNLLVLPLRFSMRGLLDGWCVMATGRKPG